LLKGEGKGARNEIFYITDDGDLSAFRYDKWKVLFTQQLLMSLGGRFERRPFFSF